MIHSVNQLVWFGGSMEIERESLRIYTIIAGFLVLASYAWGVSRLSKPTDLWGGVTPLMQKVNVAFMLLAAIGYLIYWWIVLFQISASDVANLRWPWSDSDGHGGGRLLLAFSIFLIPSMLWLESAALHMRNPSSFTPVLVIGVLFLASVGNVMLGLLAYSALQDGVNGAGWMLFGTIALSIQCILNDLIIWSWKFPW